MTYDSVGFLVFKRKYEQTKVNSKLRLFFIFPRVQTPQAYCFDEFGFYF